MEFFLLINVKIPTIIGILTIMGRKNNILGYLSLKNAEILDIFILMSIWNFMLSWVEYEKFFITSGPGMMQKMIKHIKCIVLPSTYWYSNGC